MKNVITEIGEELYDQIIKMITICKTMPYYKCCIFVKEREDRDAIYKALIYIALQYREDVDYWSKLEYAVRFANGSSIFVRDINTGSRRRFNKIVCERTLEETEWFKNTGSAFIIPYYSNPTFFNLDGEI